MPRGRRDFPAIPAHAAHGDVSARASQAHAPVDILHVDVPTAGVDLNTVLTRNMNLNRGAKSPLKSLPRHFPVQRNAPGHSPGGETKSFQKFLSAWIAGVRLSDSMIGNLPGTVGEHADIAQLHIQPQAAAIFCGNGPRFFGGNTRGILGLGWADGILVNEDRGRIAKNRLGAINVRAGKYRQRHEDQDGCHSRNEVSPNRHEILVAQVSESV